MFLLVRAPALLLLPVSRYSSRVGIGHAAVGEICRPPDVVHRPDRPVERVPGTPAGKWHSGVDGASRLAKCSKECVQTHYPWAKPAGRSLQAWMATNTTWVAHQRVDGLGSYLT